MLLLTLRGTPTLYYGDELGMRDVPIPPERARDPWGKRVPGLALGRDPERTPMQWDAGPDAGFCPPGVEPWLPLAPDHSRVNVAVQLDDPDSMLSVTRRLLALRRASPALHGGEYRALDGAPEDCFVYWRWAAGECVLVALNFSGEERTVAIPAELPVPAGGTAAWRGTVAVSTRLGRTGEVVEGALVLSGGEGCVVACEHVPRTVKYYSCTS